MQITKHLLPEQNRSLIPSLASRQTNLYHYAKIKNLIGKYTKEIIS